jgi:hypothetical protein
MKCFLVTIFFFCCAIAAYSQTGNTQKNQTQQKSENLPEGQTSAATKDKALPASSRTQKAPVISVIPTLFLWMMPANSPNPFIKEQN